MKNWEIDLTIVAFFVDFVLLIISFLVMHYVNFGNMHLTMAYLKLLMVLLVYWFFVSIWLKKFHTTNLCNMGRMAKIIFKTNLGLLYLTALTLVISGAIGFSRYHFFGMFLLLSVLELGSIVVFCSRFSFEKKSSQPIPSLPGSHLALPLAIADFVLFVCTYCIINRLHTTQWLLRGNSIQILLVMCGLWLFVSGATTKFELRHYRNIYYAFWPTIVTAVIMAGMMSVLVYTFSLYQFSRTLIFGSLLLWLIFGLGGIALFYFSRQESEEDDDIVSLKQLHAFKQQELKSYSGPQQSSADSSFLDSIRNEYLFDRLEVFNFIKKSLGSVVLHKNACLVLDTHTLFNIKRLDDRSLKLIINLAQVNNFRYINKYFLTVHDKLQNGGYFISVKDPVDLVRQRFLIKFPGMMAMILYTGHFIFFRIWPKLPVFKKIYFAFTKGRNRIIPRAELFGRLGFCGFRIVDSKQIGDNFYFIVQKTKTPSIDIEPSYGPIIKLDKIGYKGEMIKLYKLRTMHAFSEYLQDYVFEKNQLHSSGKFQDDFRVTEWGRILRKLWIDELPQVYNWIRGDVSLVGVRALSRHYFSLYPEDMQKLRIQFKPGLVPPYYADMPKSFDEIVESERRYLLKKQKRPFRTDMEYLFKASYNIIFRGARSR